MTSRVWIGVSTLGLLALLATPAFAQQAPAGQVAVTVTPAVFEEIRSKSDFLGRVQATDKVEIRAQVSGVLKQRLFTEGKLVKEGDLLFVIDQDPYQATLDQARADVASAEAMAKNAVVQLERTRDLASKGNAPQSTLDQRIAEESKAQADILKAKAVERQAEINLSWTEIRAPISGRIGGALVTPGNLVGPSTSALATLVKTDPIYVSFPVTQRELLESKRQAGSPDKMIVRLILADGSSYPEKGKIDLLDVQANTGTDSVTVRSIFPNPSGELIDGATLRAVVEAGTPEKRLMVPTAAVSLDQQGTFVLVVDKDSKVAVKRVKLGAGRGAMSVVEEGLAEGDRVIIEGMQRVRPGMPVVPSLAPAAPAKS